MLNYVQNGVSENILDSLPTNLQDFVSSPIFRDQSHPFSSSPKQIKQPKR